MDVAKVLLFLQSQALWFARQDQFEDPLEGTYTDAEVEHIRSLDLANPGLPSSISETYFRGPQHMRTTAYVSCWRAGKAESMAMWDLYAKGIEAVAVKTTIAKLKEAISESVLRTFLAQVNYVDWSLAPFDNNGLVMCFRKDSSYEHEREVRAVIWDLDVIQRNMSEALEAARLRSDFPNLGSNPFILGKQDGQLGIEVPFEISRFTNEIVVGPRATESVFNMIKNISDKYGLKLTITKSDRLTPRL